MVVWCLVMSFSAFTTQVHGQPTEGVVGYMSLMKWSFILLSISIVMVAAYGQSGTNGFISLDCGTPAGYGYTDKITDIPYTSDAQFIDTGINYSISREYIHTSLPTEQITLRSFPSGSRNCYTLKPVVQGGKYLLRASFLYGNYDGLRSASEDKPIQFDLHIGVNYWKLINISNASVPLTTEAMTVALADFISVCLINKQSGTPFISSLELRPLTNTLYPAVNNASSLVLFTRLNMGPRENALVRYPDDPYDRIWGQARYASSDLIEISAKEPFQTGLNGYFDVPAAVLRTAVTSANYSSFMLSWDAKGESSPPEYSIFMHFAELAPGVSRTFYVYLNGQLLYGNAVTPQYLIPDYINGSGPYTFDKYEFSFKATKNLTFHPILNGLEMYSVMHIKELSTDSGDADAIMAIKAWYGIKRNWVGDPCAPIAFAWDGLNCTYTISDPPRISTLNLSSSGLSGKIATSLANLTAIQFLDLSYNNLTGTIPDLLSGLSSLKLLDLTGNRFTGSIPSGLIRRSEDGFLTLRVDPNLCANGNSCEVNVMKKKKKITTPIIVILSITPVVLLLVFVFILCRMRRQKDLASSTSLRPQVKGHENDPLQLENRQFTYKELEVITNYFERAIGKGGFGTVYHGYLENGSQVAVKMHSQSSLQGDKEFLAEAQTLARVHHRNLVSLVGYCRDGNYLALVYEYMSQGTLQEHLRGKACKARALSWGERLRIAVDAAQGLEYLHNGCKPPLIHRDVKTGNILLSQGLEAKIADFGLSKVFHSDVQSHLSTAVVGTPGYVDPEYYNTFQLSGKSDVYSFGVVLLELITGRPPIISISENCNVVHWVHERLAGGNIEDVIDARMKGEYDVNSVWKAADVALNCTEQASIQRPTMADVVMQLKEGLALEAARERSANSNLHLHTESSDGSRNGIFEMAHVGNISAVSGPASR